MAFYCGTPEQHCTGGVIQTSHGIAREAKKAHGTRIEAFKCYARYLKTVEGYVQVGPREFRMPGGGILVLNKKSRFGTRLRPGKDGKRKMPRNRTGGFVHSA